jgi:transposase InsO family protein
MPRQRITDRQVWIYMDEKRQGATQIVAAARAGFSERTARRLDADPVLPSQRPPRRGRRTRVDPLAALWDAEIVPLLKQWPHWRATTILEEIQRAHPGEYDERILRTLQRRMAQWRAIEGPEQEVIFRQEHPPGLQALSDFTDAGGLAVTIAGAPFPHLLYHFWMAFSGWQFVKAIQGGESFTALTEGLQEALWQLGAAPKTHRTDRLSAAYRNLADEDDASRGYKAFCAHYGIEPTRNNAGVAHENGAVESAHGHLKRTLEEALILRGSRDFEDLAAYQHFLAETVGRRNARRHGEVAIERAAMRPLPHFKTTDFTLASAVVTRTGMICVRHVHYTVPSRLIGHRLKVHVYDDRLICFLGAVEVLQLARAHRPRGGADRASVVDYRHIIAALVKKPQAFRRYVHREALFPRTAFRRAWDSLEARLDERKACRIYVGLLHLAATQACEARLAAWLDDRLDQGAAIDLEAARLAMAPPAFAPPLVTIAAPDIGAYDALMRAAILDAPIGAAS